MSSILRALPVLLLASHALAGPVSRNHDNFLDCINEKLKKDVKLTYSTAQAMYEGNMALPETCTQKEYNTMFEDCCKSTGESHSGNMRPASQDADDRHGTPPPDASSGVDGAASKALAPDAKGLTNVDSSRKRPELAEPASDAPRPEKAPKVKESDAGSNALPDSSISEKQVEPITAPTAEKAPKAKGSDAGSNALPDSSISEKQVEPIAAPTAEKAPKVKGSDAGSNALPDSDAAKKAEPNAKDAPKGSDAGSNALPISSADSKKVAGSAPIAAPSEAGSSAPSVSEEKVDFNAPLDANAGKPDLNATKATAHAEGSLGKDAADRKSSPAIKLDAPAVAMSPAGGKDDERKKVAATEPELDAEEDDERKKVVDPNSPVKSDPNAKDLDAEGKGSKEGSKVKGPEMCTCPL